MTGRKPDTYYIPIQTAMKEAISAVYRRKFMRPPNNFWTQFHDPYYEKPPFVSHIMHALPRRDFMWNDRTGEHIFTFEYYLGIFTYMILWVVMIIIVSGIIFATQKYVVKSKKVMSKRNVRILQGKIFIICVINIFITVVVTVLLETSFVLMFKFLYIYHTCANPTEYERIAEGVDVIQRAMLRAKSPEFLKKHRKLLNKNHADIGFMKLYKHLRSQLYYLRYTIKTSVFEGTCPVAYWRTLFYVVTANILWVVVPYFCGQMLIISIKKPTRTGFHKTKKFALLVYLSCWGLSCSMLWLIMIASDYCNNPAITTANMTYKADFLTPYYLGVMPYKHLQNGINFFKELKTIVNHTRFGDAFYGPQYTCAVILDEVSHFYYDLMKEAQQGNKEVKEMLNDIGDPIEIKNALNLTIDYGFVGLYKGKFIRPIHDRLMLIACRYWIPVVLAILVLLLTLFGTSATLIIYAIRALKDLGVFVAVGAFVKKARIIPSGEWGLCVNKLKEKEIDREKKKRSKIKDSEIHIYLDNSGVNCCSRLDKILSRWPLGRRRATCNVSVYETLRSNDIRRCDKRRPRFIRTY